MILWLDDVRPPWKFGFIGAEWVKTYHEAIAFLIKNKNQITFASLDHDLSEAATLGNWINEKTGYDVLCYMEEYEIWPKDGIRVHSLNPAGKIRMHQVIERHYGRIFV